VPGFHILYAYAGDGSPVPGAVEAYGFLVAVPTISFAPQSGGRHFAGAERVIECGRGNYLCVVNAFWLYGQRRQREPACIRCVYDRRFPGAKVGLTKPYATDTKRDYPLPVYGTTCCRISWL
jgi:hypothetical protein